MRGSNVERRQANVAAVTAGILLPDEVREIEGFNPLPPRSMQWWPMMRWTNDRVCPGVFL
jgi:hypothetical protein